MSTSPGSADEPARRRLVDLSPLRASPAFARLWIGGTVAGIGTWMTQVAVGLLVFDITRSSLAVALVGGIALIPAIIAGLWGGMLIDSFDRRRVLLASAVLGWGAAAAILILAIADAVLQGDGERIAIWPFYVLTSLTAVAGSITQAGRRAVIPRLLGADMVARASALNGISLGSQLTVGPALAGVLVAAFGFPIAFALDVLLTTTLFLGIVSLPALPPLEQSARPGLESVKEGLAFLRTAPNVRMSFLVDIVAMTLGRPHSLLPAVGALAIGGGSVTVGVLTASFAVGTFLTSLFSGPVARVHRYGVAIGRAITVFGASVFGFGLVVAISLAGWLGPSGEDFSQVNWAALILAVLFLVGCGAADEVSAIFRSTILLTAAPDSMRGRLQGIFIVVVSGGPRLGDLYAGILATLVALWFPPVLGGLLVMALISVLLRLSPGFRGYDARSPTP